MVGSEGNVVVSPPVNESNDGSEEILVFIFFHGFDDIGEIE